MTRTPDQERRRARLESLLNHQDFGGNKSELARALGWSGGAYVRQLVAGERPITEKTVLAIESARGGKYRGWFSSDDDPQASAAPQITDQDRALLADLAELLPDEQARWRAEIHAAAEYARKIRSWQPSGVPAEHAHGEVVDFGASKPATGQVGLTSIKSRKGGSRQHSATALQDQPDETGKRHGKP